MVVVMGVLFSRFPPEDKIGAPGVRLARVRAGAGKASRRGAGRCYPRLSCPPGPSRASAGAANRTKLGGLQSAARRK